MMLCCVRLRASTKTTQKKMVRKTIITIRPVYSRGSRIVSLRFFRMSASDCVMTPADTGGTSSAGATI